MNAAEPTPQRMLICDAVTKDKKNSHADRGTAFDD